MASGITQFLVDQFYHNQFMTAAVVAAPAGLVTYSLRELPGKLWSSARHTLSLELRFNSDSDSYYRVQEFVLQRVVIQRWSRTWAHFSEERYAPSDGEHKTTGGLSVGYGTHWGVWRGRPVLVSRELNESANTEKFKENMVLTFFGRGLGLLQGFVRELDAYLKLGKEEVRVPLYINGEHGWRRMSPLPLRSINTVITADRAADRVLAHVRDFESKREWYRQRGMPYHTGVMLEGSPGNGKTSLMHAVASETGRILFYLNLAGFENENQLMQVLGDRYDLNRGILVLEDVDVSGASVTRGEKRAVSLSTFLNMLDGHLTPDGLVVMASTNHPENLDPALVRPGRFDLVVRLEELGWPEFQRMAELFEIDPAVVRRCQPTYRPTSGATLRNLMLNPALGGLENHFRA